MTYTEIFELVAAEIERQNISKLELTRKMKIHPATIHGMYRRKKIPLHRLIQLSEILNYNFFQVIAKELHISNPENSSIFEDGDSNYAILKLQAKIEVLEEMYAKAIAENVKG